VAPLKQLQEKYRNRDVEFLTVYVREAHPGEGAYREYSQPQEFDQKLAYARMLVAKEHFTCPVLVDGMDEAVHRQYGSLPNMVYVIDKTGKIAYKATWTLAEELDQILAELTGDEPAPACGCGGV
jgi:Iodothyronine deiodinase